MRHKSLKQKELDALALHLGHPFTNSALLSQALTHRSFAFHNNERLEFLGDAILNCVIAIDLFHRYPSAEEGELTRMRASLVRGETVAEVARELGLGDSLCLGIGELKSGGHDRSSILSDALEAVIAAIFLDSGLENCQAKILSWYKTRLEDLVLGHPKKDPKTELQEYLQARHLPLPRYEIIEIGGEVHHPRFKISCSVEVLQEPVLGSSDSRRKAEQTAAALALQQLRCL